MPGTSTCQASRHYAPSKGRLMASVNPEIEFSPFPTREYPGVPRGECTSDGAAENDARHLPARSESESAETLLPRCSQAATNGVCLGSASVACCACRMSRRPGGPPGAHAPTLSGAAWGGGPASALSGPAPHPGSGEAFFASGGKALLKIRINPKRQTACPPSW